jgi:hypothetical protein
VEQVTAVLLMKTAKKFQQEAIRIPKGFRRLKDNLTGVEVKAL